MIFGIDATNISSGGGLTHLREMLHSADPFVSEDKVVLWSSSNTLTAIENRPWLIKRSHQYLDGSIIQRQLWKPWKFDKDIRSMGCNVLFAPGANYSGSFHPYVSMFQNMLPFEKKERARFFPLPDYFRYRLLEITQSRSFANADGMIYLTEYAKSAIHRTDRMKEKPNKIVAHGINSSFYRNDTPETVARGKPFKWLYVSIINHYKHQDKVVQAISQLRKEGYPVTLELVGPIHKSLKEKFDSLLNTIDPNGEFIKYAGLVPYNKLPAYYHQADAFVFASSCENLPNIMLEAMAARLPIASSNLGPMPEVLKDNGQYFDPEDVRSIKNAMRSIVDNHSEAIVTAISAEADSRQYTWERCAEGTFEFLRQVAKSPRF